MPNRIRELRTARQLSQGDLAREMSVSRQTVNAIETEGYTPSQPLAKAFRRWDAIAVLAAPGEDERTGNVHMRAAATSRQVMALVIVGGFLHDVVRGAVDHSIWPPAGGVFGVTHLVGLFIAARRG